MGSTIFLGTIFYYDPLKIFHKPWNYKSYLQSNMREQVAGILRYWEYDSIILGTSILENTSAKETSTLLGSTFVNVSIAGSDYFERSLILDYALKNKKIKKVLYSLDNLGATRRGDPIYSYKKWNYLYDTNPFNDINVYLNSKYLPCIFSINTIEGCSGTKRDLDRPKAWYRDKVAIATFGGFDKWIEHKDSVNMKHAFYLIGKSFQQIKEKKILNQQRIIAGIARTEKYINSYILRHAQEYPNTEFILVVPPYSRLVNSLILHRDMDSFLVYLKSIKYLVKLSSQQQNIKIYAWGNEDFLDDISNYRDLTHFSEKINSWMLSAIRNNDGLLTLKNVDKYLKIVMKKTKDYNLSSIENKMKAAKLY
jgi:hypothetical protein